MDTHITEGQPSGAGAVQSLAPLELAEETETYYSDENRTAEVASHPSQLSTTTAASPEEAVEQQQQPQQKVTSSSTASHGEVDDECPSLAPNREGIADQSGPGNTTLCPPDIHADAMLDTVSVSATPTDSFIDRPSTSQSGPGQTYAPTAAIGTRSLPATPPVQPDTAAYTQVGRMDPSHSRPFIDNQLGPRYPGQDPQAPAPTEPQ